MKENLKVFGFMALLLIALVLSAFQKRLVKYIKQNNGTW
jgi:hypothetical protein